MIPWICPVARGGLWEKWVRDGASQVRKSSRVSWETRNTNEEGVVYDFQLTDQTWTRAKRRDSDTARSVLPWEHDLLRILPSCAACASPPEQTRSPDDSSWASGTSRRTSRRRAGGSCCRREVENRLDGAVEEEGAGKSDAWAESMTCDGPALRWRDLSGESCWVDQIPDWDHEDSNCKIPAMAKGDRASATAHDRRYLTRFRSLERLRWECTTSRRIPTRFKTSGLTQFCSMARGSDAIWELRLGNSVLESRCQVRICCERAVRNRG